MNTEVKREETWYDYPQKVKSWGNDIDYVMFVDENNSVDKQQVVYKKITNNIPISDDEKFFYSYRMYI